MGVRGLTTLLQEKHHTHTETLPPNALLFVDGSGFLFHLLSAIEIQQSLQNENFYQRLHQQIISEVEELKSLGLHLIFFFDGKKTQFKSETKRKRQLENEQRWRRFHGLVTDSQVTYSQEQLPIPTLSAEQLIVSLLSLELPVHLCEGETDQELARACKASNDFGTPSYCYSEDR
jgi:5'-3' exonuclease